jgi:sarcosine oxidase, subunit gamma
MTHNADATAAIPTIEELPPVARFSLRARATARDSLGAALGLTLPTRIGDRARSGGREVVCLGPDEWLIVGPEADGPSIAEAAAAAYAATPHALANISDREVSVRISGPGTLSLLAMGCPRDLSKLASGRAVRTVFDGATVVLWRDGEEDFRLDAWRSFAPHCRALLETGLSELRAGL